MQVILTEDIPKLGHAGDVVRVKDGFGRNYLLPRGMALLATRGRVRDLEHKRRVIEEKLRKEVGALEVIAKRVGEMTLEFEVHASEEGKLFGSVTNADIAEQIREKGMEVERRKIELPEPIKQVGDYQVSVRFHREVKAEVTVKVTSPDVVVAPPEEEPPEEESAEPAEDQVE
jgi:large subunit ribosomal protein L9